MTQAELWDWIMDGNYPPNWPKKHYHRTAIATLTESYLMKKFVDHGKPYIEKMLPAGTKVKVVMASRFGDVGITDDLDATSGYHARIQCVDFHPDGSDRVIQPQMILDNIEPIKAPEEEPAGAA